MPPFCNSFCNSFFCKRIPRNTKEQNKKTL
nr:MAG TPA: hypothetical protein [Caudoviricetes sp.]